MRSSCNIQEQEYASTCVITILEDLNLLKFQIGGAA